MFKYGKVSALYINISKEKVIINYSNSLLITFHWSNDWTLECIGMQLLKLLINNLNNHTSLEPIGHTLLYLEYVTHPISSSCPILYVIVIGCLIYHLNALSDVLSCVLISLFVQFT